MMGAKMYVYEGTEVISPYSDVVTARPLYRELLRLPQWRRDACKGTLTLKSELSPIW